MSRFFGCVEKAQKGNKESLSNVVQKFKPKINKLLKETSPQNKEDLQQELIISLIKKTKDYKLDEVPGFEEFKNRM